MAYNSMDNMKISIIIPCYNEEKNITRCFESIQSIDYPKELIQVILVDNGSSDKSVEIANKYTKEILIKANCTVGALRNYGANIATGDIIAFLDADCEVDSNWIKSFLPYFNGRGEKVGVVGSVPLVPQTGNLIQKAWFSQRETGLNMNATYIGSANMIILRNLFESIGRFDDKLTSGEDFELCRRIINSGYHVIIDPRIICYHYGYPETIKSFIKREIWHGQGMIADFKDPLKSKPLVLSIYYIITNIIRIASIFLIKNSIIKVITVNLIILFIELLPLVIYSTLKLIRYKPIKYIIIINILYYVYGLSRSFSLIIIICKYIKEYLNITKLKEVIYEE